MERLIVVVVPFSSTHRFGTPVGEVIWALTRRDMSSDPALQMRGMGKEIQAEDGADSLVARERAGWSGQARAEALKMRNNISAAAILKKLRAMANPKNVEGMARFGIPTHDALGINIPTLRKLAREIGVSHELAAALWQSGYHEGRILATMLDPPASVSERQVERWVKEIDSWSVCDACCLNLFVETSFAHRKALEWSRREEEFVRRAGFALMAALAVHDKRAADAKFVRFLPAIKRASVDERNFVKKAVNWALRQIGKRNLCLNRTAIKACREIRKIDSRSARWIAADALRELASDVVQRRLRRQLAAQGPVSGPAAFHSS